MTSILETAKQVVEWRTLAKTSGDLGKDGFARVHELIKLGFPETIYKNETVIAAALLEAEKLLKHYRPIIEKYGHTQGDMKSWSEELLGPLDAFLSRISTGEQ